MYEAHDLVEENGEVYSCKGWPYFIWCGSKDYNPTGDHGHAVWSMQSDCIENHCAVDCSIPGSWLQHERDCCQYLNDFHDESSTPTMGPSFAPTFVPSYSPTFVPTVAPTTVPTTSPTQRPTIMPTTSPTQAPIQPPTPPSPTSAPSKDILAIQLQAIAYSPFRNRPFSCSDAVYENIHRDLEIARLHTNRIRTYMVQRCNLFGEMILYEAKEYGMRVYLGLQIDDSDDDNDDEIDELRRLFTTPGIPVDVIDAVIIGNEALYSKYLDSDDIIDYIRTVKMFLPADVIITYADVDRFYTAGIAAEVDVVMLNIHPFHSDKLPHNSMEYLKRKKHEYEQLFNKEVIIGEHGYPSAGGTKGKAVASIANAEEYIRQTIATDLGRNVFFALFDGEWKYDDDVPWASHWGIYTSNREFKYRCHC